MGRSILRLPSRLAISRLTMEHSAGAFSPSIVVNESFVFLPLVPSFSSRASVQKVVFEPESRNAYVSTIFETPFALT